MSKNISLPSKIGGNDFFEKLVENKVNLNKFIKEGYQAFKDREKAYDDFQDRGLN